MEHPWMQDQRTKKVDMVMFLTRVWDWDNDDDDEDEDEE